MSWADLDWPDLSPDFPAPGPTSPPPPPPLVPADIAARVQRAERRRGVFVPLCALAGSLLLCAGLAMYRVAPHRVSGSPAPLPALLLLLAAFLVAFPLPALTVLFVIGPTWRQRRQHLRLLLWQRERVHYRERERARYLASLSPEQRAAFPPHLLLPAP